MGLDMYITKRNKDQALVENESYDASKEVAYWRKFNALHGWFVANIQNGVDDCGLYEVTKDTLHTLLDVLEEVHNLKNPAKLPPTSGFFFGSAEADDWYWSDVENTIKVISDLIDNTDWDKEQLYYFSSW
jgi:hypothetical protein